MTVSAATRVFALLGEPVAHSLSPVMQNAAFRATGVDAVYVALRVDPAALAAVLRTIARSGGGNVTTPHKVAAAAVLDRSTAAVDRTGACNTFWMEGGQVCGDNTDVAGLHAAVAAVAGSAAGMRVLLIGAGGAAAAAACALLDARVAAIDVLNRSVTRARTLASRLDPPGATMRALDAAVTIDAGGYDLIINATTLGLHAADPLPLSVDTARGAVLDLVYRPGETAWVRHARARGLAAADGRAMLLHQGAAAYQRWFGGDAPLVAMRAALEEAARP